MFKRLNVILSNELIGAASSESGIAEAETEVAET